jgi:hypothetical protein
MKKFTIPCDFGGKKAPFDVYIGHPKGGNHPLQNQAAWLSAERGGNIPPDVMESFAKLLKLSAENGVEFEDLCVYALEEANKEKSPAPQPATRAPQPAVRVPQPMAAPAPQAAQPPATVPAQQAAPAGQPVEGSVNEHGQEVRYNPVPLKMGDGSEPAPASSQKPQNEQ